MQAGHCLDLVSLGFADVKKEMEKIKNGVEGGVVSKKYVSL